MAIGKWLKVNGSTIYGTIGNNLPPQKWGVVTRKNKTLYVHILQVPLHENFILLPGLQDRIVTASMFKGKGPIKFKQTSEGVFLYPDVLKTDGIDTIVQIVTR